MAARREVRSSLISAMRSRGVVVVVETPIDTAPIVVVPRLRGRLGNASIRRGMADRSQTGTRKARVTTNDNRGDSKNNGPRGGGPLNRIRAVGSYRLAVASSNGRFVAVVDVT